MQDWLSDEQLLQLIKQLDADGNGLSAVTAASPEPPQGWLELKDGKISWVSPEHPSTGRLPVVEALPPLNLVINGETVRGPVQVKPDDVVEWYSEQKSYRIDVSPDKMKVWLILLPDGKFRFRPADEEKTDRLVLKPEEDLRSPILLPTLQTLLEALQEMGIVHYDLSAIMRELGSPTYVPVLIGQGLEPVPGKDAALELYFSERIENRFEEINGFVDFRNHLKIPSVRKGDLILRKIPPTKSRPGFNVFGEKVDVPRPKDFVMLGRQNVRIEGNEAYAERDGRPRVTGDKIKVIDIATTHVVPGDVDLKTGNVVFTGDIQIYGNVHDGMIVEALGNVYIAGNVYRATITATGSIYVKGNTIGSKLYSGHYGVLFNRLYNNASKLNERLTLYRQAAGQLQQLAAERGHAVTDRQVYQMLMESKFRDIPELCRAILNCITSIQSIQKDLMNDLKVKLESLMKTQLLRQGEIGDFIVGLQQGLIQTIDRIRRSEEKEVCTDIQQCQLTEILSNGNIVIRKQGVLQSRLYSKKNIVFCQYDSVCRGSELEAGEAISAMIVGGVSGGATRLKAGRKVEVSLMYDGRVTVGRFSKEILSPVENVCFHVKNNKLVTDSIAMPSEEIRYVAHESEN